MKPPAFTYAAPETPAEALRLMRAMGDGAMALAGGQSLVPMLNFRLAAPETLIDLNRLSTWSFIEQRGSELAIGAMTRQAEVEDSPLVKRCCPLLAEAVVQIAHRPIRNRGTLGGSMALAYPGAELPAVMVALDGALLLESDRGERRVAACDFLQGPLETALEPGELISTLFLPVAPRRSGAAFVEVARRHGDYGLAAAAAVLDADGEGRIALARLCVTGVLPVPARLSGAEARLSGTPLAEAMGLIRDGSLAHAAVQELEIADEPGQPAAYRRQLAQTVLSRALTLSAERLDARHA